MKITKQVIGMNFNAVVQELEEAVLAGYRVVYDGGVSPYHMIMGQFIITLDKEDTLQAPVSSSEESSAATPSTGTESSVKARVEAPKPLKSKSKEVQGELLV
jgi:hypothetical protein